MTLKNLIESLQIVAKYTNDPAREGVQAEHDEIFFPLENSAVLAQEDEARLLELGARRTHSDCWGCFT